MILAARARASVVSSSGLDISHKQLTHSCKGPGHPEDCGAAALRLGGHSCQCMSVQKGCLVGGCDLTVSRTRCTKHKSLLLCVLLWRALSLQDYRTGALCGVQGSTPYLEVQKFQSWLIQQASISSKVCDVWGWERCWGVC